MGIVFKFFGIAAAVVVIVFMAVSAFRRARRLDARIREFQAEQDELAQTGVRDPYAAMAELYSQQKKQTPKQ